MKKKSIIMLTFVVIAVGGVLLYPTIFPSKSERKVLYWTDPMMPGFKSEKPGKSPMGMDMVPVYDTSKGRGETTQPQENQQSQVDYYTCPMHPDVRSSQPGHCPRCGMDLVANLPRVPAGAAAVPVLLVARPPHGTDDAP